MNKPPIPSPFDEKETDSHENQPNITCLIVLVLLAAAGFGVAWLLAYITK